MKKKLSNFIFIIVIFLTVFAIKNSTKGEIKVEAVTPNGVYMTLSSNASEVMPGEYATITFSIYGLGTIPPSEDGVSNIMLYLYFDSDKFELPIEKTYMGEAIVKDEVKILGPQFDRDRLYLEDIICKFMLDNPSYVTIEIPYNYAARRNLSTDGDMFSIKFLALEDASGTANFHMTEKTSTGYGYVYTGTSNNKILIDNSLANIDVKVTGEPETEYAINFDSNGGSIVTPITATYGSPIIRPTNPTKTGYDFVDWYDGLTPFVFSTMPNHDVNLQAKWVPINYKIEYLGNGGVGNMASVNVNFDEQINLSTNQFTRTGYIFKGWSMSPNGNVDYSNNQLVSNLRSSAGVVKLYAIWEKVGYNLFINSPFLEVKRGSIPLVNGDKIYIDDILNITYNRLGYANATILGNGVVISGNTYTVANSDLLLTIQNEVLINYAINYNLDGGTNNIANPNTFTINSPTIHLQAPTKEGYTFDGWYTRPSGGVRLTTIDSGTTGEVTIYARWLSSYTITLDLNGGEINSNSEPYIFFILQNQKYGSNLLTPNKKGYAFVGWYSDLVGGTKITSNDIATSSTTLYARWQAKTSTIAFNSNGGTSVLSITNPYGSLINMPTPPTRRGYTFMGWYLDNNTFTNEVTFPLLMSDEDLLLHAKWEINQYTIFFEINGGSSIPSITKSYGEMISKPEDPTRSGYIFAGWYTDNHTFANPYSFTTMKDFDVTLYAKWVRVYTVTFDYQDSITEISTTDILDGANFGSLPTPVRNGYSFLGWFTAKGGTGQKITSTSKYTFNTDVTLYANWELKRYTISFNTNGGSPVSSINEYYNNPIPLPTQPSRLGYRFIGWYLDNNTFKNQYDIPNLMPSENIVLYAKWEIRDDISITFEVNGGSSVSNLDNLTFQATFTYPITTKTGYKFVGWYSDAGFKTLHTSTKVPAEDLTLYAKWIEEYKIDFEYNNGNSQTSIIKYAGETYGDLPKPSKLGHKFAGWYTTSDFSVSTLITSNDNVSSSLTLYAKWDKESYTVSYNSEGGSEVIPNLHTYYYGEEINVPENPTRDGYIFSGWYTAKDGLVEYIFSTMPASNLNLYAKWVKESSIQYEVNLHNFDNKGQIHNIYRYGGETYSFPQSNVIGYNLIGWYLTPDYQESTKVSPDDILSGTNTKIDLYAKWEIKLVTIKFYDQGVFYFEIIQDYNTLISEPTSPTRDGHTFIGWFASNDNGVTLLGNQYEFTTMPGEDLNLYAKWEANLYTIIFNSNGGSDVASITRAYGTNNINLPRPLKTGYKFLGWFDEENEDNYKVNSPYTITKDVTLLAKWELEGFDNTNLLNIEIKSNGDVIKTITNISNDMLIYVKNEFEVVDIIVNPIYSITEVNYLPSVTLDVGISFILEINVKAASGRVEKYFLTIIRDTSPFLTNIKLNNDLDLVFDGANNYNLNAPINVSNVEVRTWTNDGKNSVTINGQKITLNYLEGYRVVSLNNAGTTTLIKIIVTSLSGEESNEYTISVYRSAMSNEAKLTSLSLSGNNSYNYKFYQEGTNNIGFNTEIESYYMNLPYLDTEVIVNPIYPIGASGAIEGNRDLSVGLNLITIEVTAADGITKKVYTITVTKEAPCNVAKIDEVLLKNLDNNILDFQTQITYGIINTIYVPYSVKRINLVPTKSLDSINAVIADLGNLDILEGINDFILKITAEDKTTVTEYNIRIIREYGNTDNVLSLLSIGDFELTPTLDLNNIFNYSLVYKLPYTTNSLVIFANKVSQEYGYITIKYGSSAKVEATSLVINPVVGISTIEIVVHPEKGFTNTYIITIEKENISGNYELSSLYVRDKNDNALLLNPEFNMQVLDYNLSNVSYAINELKVTPLAVVGSIIETVEFNGVLANKVNNDYIGSLKEGNNKIIIIVASSLNPNNKKQYSINVYREIGDTINTATINSSVGRLDRNGENYTLTLPKSSTGFILSVIRDSDKSLVKINNESINSKYFDFRSLNSAIYTVEVISEVGVSNVYTINVVRSNLSDNAKLNSLIVTGKYSNQKTTLNNFPASLTLPYIDSIVEFNPIFQEIGASINISGANINVGLNSIVIIVTAEDGMTQESYIINITRENASDIYELENIIINNKNDESIEYSLNEKFESNKYTYSANVEFSTQSVIINPITIAGLGISYLIKDKNGNLINNIVNLNEGSNNFIIEVISESGNSCEYYLEIIKEAGDNDNSLEILEITDKDLDFEKDKLSYPAIGYFDYSFDYNNLLINAKTSSTKSKIILQVGSNLINFGNEANYNLTLNVGITSIKIIVVAENGSERVYRINLRKVAYSGDVDIYNILINGIDVNSNLGEEFKLYDSLGNLVEFDRNNFTYYTTIPFKYTNIQISPQVINSKISSSNLIYEIISGDIITAVIKIDSEDGQTSVNYTIYIKGETGDNDTTLKSIQVLDKNNINYLHSFNSNTYLYDLELPKSKKSIKITAVPSSPLSSIIIGDKTMRPFDPNNIDVSEAVDIYIWVIAEDGSSKPYVVRIRKSAKSDNAYLESIEITNGKGEDLTKDLIPKFSPTNLVYQMVVEYNVTELYISGVGIDDAKIISGNHITNLQVLPYSNISEVVVEALDGTRLTYTFLIFRLPALSDASVTEIKVNNNKINIQENVYEYSLDIPYTIKEVTIKINPNSRVSNITINEIDYYDDMSLSIELGNNEFNISVVAEDGITTINYKLIIIRQSASAKAVIENLDITNSPTAKFKTKLPNGSYQDTEYNSNMQVQYIFVESKQTSIVLSPKLSLNASIKESDNGLVSANLDLGYNIIVITVVAEDEITENIYFFIVKRGEPSSNTKLKEIIVRNEETNLDKISDELYKVNLNGSAKELNLDITLADESSNYEVLGNENLHNGDIIRIVVTAEDGSTSTYYLIIDIPTQIEKKLTINYILLAIAISGIISTAVLATSLIILKKKY